MSENSKTRIQQSKKKQQRIGGAHIQEDQCNSIIHEYFGNFGSGNIHLRRPHRKGKGGLEIFHVFADSIF